MKPLLFLLFLFALFFAAIVLQAQTTGTLEGCVADTSGAGIPGARIEVVGTSRGAVTRPNGNYLIAGLRAGTYTIRIASVGMETQEHEIKISVCVTTTLNVVAEDREGAMEVCTENGSADTRVIVIPNFSICQIDPGMENASGRTTNSVFSALLRDASLCPPDGCQRIRSCYPRFNQGDTTCIPCFLDRTSSGTPSSSIDSTFSIE